MPKLSPLLGIEQIESVLLTKIPDLEESRDITKHLNHYDASVPQTAAKLAHLMNNSGDDRVQLSAVKTSLQLHGFLHKEENKNVVNISFIMKEGDVQLQQILNPIRGE